MILLGRLTLAFLVESLGLIALWSAMGVAAAAAALVVSGSRPRTLQDLVRPGLWSAGGAMVAGSLAHRLELAEPLLLAVGRREIPILWSVVGAVAVATILVLARRMRPPEVSP